MPALHRVCVFCGSSLGKRESYRRATESMGRLLAQENIELVYGGGQVGLMGVLAGYSVKEVHRSIQKGQPQMTVSDLLGTPLPADLVQAKKLDQIL